MTVDTDVKPTPDGDARLPDGPTDDDAPQGAPDDKDAAPVPTDGEDKDAAAGGKDAAPDDKSGDDKNDDDDVPKPKRKRPGKRDRHVARLESKVAALSDTVERLTEDKAKPGTDAAPKIDDFETEADYIAAKATFNAKAEIRQETADANAKAERSRSEKDREVRQDAYEDRVADFAEDNPDYAEVVNDPDLRISDAMAEVIMDSEHGPDVAYHLGQNPDEARRIAGLAPLAAARELGRIEAGLTRPAPKPKTSSAPDPVTRLKGGGSPQSDPENESMDEYAARRRKEMAG